MNRVFVTIGPFTIYWYSVLIIAAVLVGYHLVVKYSNKINFKTSAIMDMLLYLVIWAIVGARVYYVIFNFSVYEDNLVDIFKIWNGGLAIYGAVIGGALYMLYYCLKNKLSFVRVLDIFSLSLLFGQAIGRWGNFFNGEAYGGETTYEALASLHIPEFIIQGMYIEGTYRQPTFLYESLWCLIGVGILCWIRKRHSNVVGKQICFYLIWYGVGRLVIEAFRSDSLYLGSFRVSQLVSLAFVVIGIIGQIMIKLKSRVGSKEVSGINGRI